MAAAQNRRARRRQRLHDMPARSCPPQGVTPGTAPERIPGSPPMPGYARFIGRVGALAVALGVGVAVASSYGAPVAQADDTTQTSNDKPSDSPSNDDNTDTNNDNQDNENDDEGDDNEDDDDGEDGQDEQKRFGEKLDEEQNAGVTENQLGQDGGPGNDETKLGGDGLGLEATNAENQPPVDPPVEVTPPVDLTPPVVTEQTPEAPKPPVEPVTPPPVVDPVVNQNEPATTNVPESKDVKPSGEKLLDSEAPVEFTVEQLDGADNRLTAFTTEDAQTFSTLIAPEPNIIEPEQPDIWAGLATIPGVAARLAYTVTAAFLSPFLVGGPTAPVQPPVLWAVLAWVRREFQRTLFNETPTAVDDTSITTSEDVSVDISALLNDVDTDEDPLTVTDYTQPENGTVTYDPVTKKFTYTPDEGFSGTDTFQYAVSDHAGAPHWHGPLAGLFNVGHQDTATVTVTVAAVDDAATMGPDAADVNEDTTKVLDPTVLLQNDTDPDGELTFTGVGNASDGATVTYENGAVFYTPASDFNGTATFEYYATDPDGNINTGVVTMTVVQVDDGATMLPDAAPVDEDTTKVLDPTVLLQNDTDPDGDLTFTGVGNASDGATVTYENGAIYYTPAPGFTGPATFDYYATDPDGNINTGTVTMTVNPVGPTDIEDPLYSVNPEVVNAGSRVEGLTMSPDGKTLYAVDLTAGKVVVIDADPASPTFNEIVDVDPTDADVDTIDVGGQPLFLSITPDGKRGYVGTQSGGFVKVIDLDPTSTTYHQVIAEIPIAGYPVSVAFTPDGTRAYVANRAGGDVSVIDLDPTSTTYHEVIDADPSDPDVDNIDVGGGPITIVMSSDGKRAYVANQSTNTVSIIDVDPTSSTFNRRIDSDSSDPDIDDIPIGSSGPTGMALTPDGKRLYVAAQGGSVAVVDVDPSSSTFHQRIDTDLADADIDNISAGALPIWATTSPGGRYVYVSNYTTGATITVIDTTTDTVVGAPIALGGVGNAVVTVVSPDGSRIYVARSTGDLTMINVTSGVV